MQVRSEAVRTVGRYDTASVKPRARYLHTVWFLERNRTLVTVAALGDCRTGKGREFLFPVDPFKCWSFIF